MSAIGPGDRVEFMGPTTLRGRDSGLAVGSTYVVERTWVAEDVLCANCGRDPLPALSLRGQPGNWPSYCVCCFRPLGGAADVVEQLKAFTSVAAPAPTPVHSPAPKVLEPA